MLTFEAHEGYFLGRPKVDVVYIRTINDPNTLLANLLAGTVDIFPTAALNDEPALQLKERWEASGAGKVHLVPGGNERYVVPQFRPEFQAEPTNLDIRVRTALSHAIDREALAEAMHSGRAAIYSILPPGSRSYESTKDGLRPLYSYNPDRAKALLQEAGWTPGPDGVLRNATDGRRFRTTLWVAGGGPKEISIIADYWSQVGVDVELYDVPVAQARDRRFRSTFPGWENSSGDALSIMKGPITSAETNWSGHRAGYVNPQAEELVNTYYRSISAADQLRAAKAMSDMFARDLPMLLLYYRVRYVGARANVKALDDAAGSGEIQLGSTMRNAHQWEIR
jgi:peptide/nickel transport system substrate-binding protein